jgi:hypothetical protein
VKVDYIEQDAVVSLNTYVTQTSPSWGIARISHQSLSTTQYVYDDSAGEGVCAYIIDTGILTTHSVGLMRYIYPFYLYG